MACTVIQSRKGSLLDGRYVIYGVAQWTSTNTTGTLPVVLDSRVNSVQLTGIGSDEAHYWADAVSATTGDFTLPSTKLISVGRDDTAPTSGQLFSFMITGY